jgi:hypothetical protein
MANQSKSPIKREHKFDLLYFIAVLFVEHTLGTLGA